MTAPLVARGNAGRCMKCGRAFEKADRVHMAYIFVQAVKNPVNPLQVAAELLSQEFEFTHVDCNDPGLERGAGSQIILDTRLPGMGK